MNSRAFSGLAWAYTYCIVVWVFIGFNFFISPGNNVLLHLNPAVFGNIFIAYCIYRLRGEDKNFKTAFLLSCVSIVFHLFFLLDDQPYNHLVVVYWKAYLVIYISIDCLMLWIVCGGIDSLANKLNQTNLPEKALYRRKFYVLAHGLFGVYVVLITYGLSFIKFKNPNDYILLLPFVFIFFTMVLAIYISYVFIINLFRQAARELITQTDQ